MTDIMKLAEEHAVACSRLGDHYVHTRAALQSAIEALQGENERLKTENDNFSFSMIAAANRKLREDNNALQAKLDELQRQGPVAWCEEDGMHYHPNLLINKGLKLYAAPKALEPESIQWIVNDLGELGVKAGNRFMFLYKGDSIEYGEDDIGTAKHSDGTPMKYRIVGKREFGEVCHPLKWIANNRSEPRYTEELVFTPGLSFGTPEDGEWRELPAAHGITKGTP